jgi:asparagine synthase (glutamine-hydrolysing)
MCGIFGIVNPEIERADYACGILRHRGPDSFGHWKDRNVVLEHTRLSILDLSSSAGQPFAPIADKVLVFNGEIFNFAEIRAALTPEYEFQTTSDTEALYYAFHKWGVSCLPRLNGMFAFAFYDRARGKLWLVRDRFGVKPLYYSVSQNGLIFASEQKAIYPYIEARVDRRALREYFGFKYVSARRTMVEGVWELEPGAYLEIELHPFKVNEARWYSLPLRRGDSSDELQEGLEALIEDSIRLRLISDVPLGVQLSGGVDSSIITRIVSRLTPNQVNTYSINCLNSPYDEGAHAQNIADVCGVQHHPIDFTADNFLELWDAAAYHNDEPLNHPHSLPIMKLTEVARDDVTVLLSGEGADEVFAGYPHAKRFLNARDSGEYLDFGRFNDSTSLGEMLVDELLNEADEFGGRQGFIGAEGREGTGYANYEFRTHLNTLLNRVDKMSMANAMEIRTPFLDYRVVKVGVEAPLSALIGKDGQGRKEPLMNLYETFFHNGQSTRSKIGFRVPWDEWMREKLSFREFVCDRIEHVRSEPIFKDGYIDRLINSLHRNVLPDATLKQIWTVVNYAIWRRQFPRIGLAFDDYVYH